MLDMLTGLEADITLSGQGEDTTDFVCTQVQKYPLFRPLAMVLKETFALQNFNRSEV